MVTWKISIPFSTSREISPLIFLCKTSASQLMVNPIRPHASSEPSPSPGHNSSPPHSNSLLPSRFSTPRGEGASGSSPPTAKSWPAFSDSNLMATTSTSTPPTNTSSLAALAIQTPPSNTSPTSSNGSLSQNLIERE